MSNNLDAIPAHGGTLVNRTASPEQKQEFLTKPDSLPRVELDERAVSDWEMIAIGGFIPLTGFMIQADYKRVVSEMRLANGVAWSIPITLSVDEKVANLFKKGDLIRLDNQYGEFIGVLEFSEKYEYDKKLH